MSRNNTSYLKRLYTCPSTQTSPSSKYYPNSTDEKHASKKDVLQMTENQSQSGLSNERYVSFCVCCVRVCVCVRERREIERQTKWTKFVVRNEPEVSLWSCYDC